MLQQRYKSKARSDLGYIEGAMKGDEEEGRKAVLKLITDDRVRKVRLKLEGILNRYSRMANRSSREVARRSTVCG